MVNLTILKGKAMTLGGTTEAISYDAFCEQWLMDVEECGLSSLDKGRRFAANLITHWLDITTDDDDFFVCDGPGDGGIDVAYLKRAEVEVGSTNDNLEEGDTWYIVQGKYGSSFSGYAAISMEGQKVINTLLGLNETLSSDSKQLLEKLKTFQLQASPADRIVLVFATRHPISESDRLALDTIKRDAREQVFDNFDVEELSLKTIWEELVGNSEKLLFSLDGKFVEQGAGLLVGTVSLVNLFKFFKAYQTKTGSLDQLYEKNVRQFLGSRRKINKGIQDTLNQNPEKFGLYNNGITLVVSDYSGPLDDGTIEVDDPFVVNGCQTTRTIWQVLDGKFNSGGTGENPTVEDWKERANLGGVVTKIVRSEEAEIINITRYTNLQNSVRAQDFIALDSGFQNWAREMATRYDLLLEIQRGGIDSRKAYEKQHLEEHHYSDYVSAFDLIKIYGAGWLALPGTAFRANAPFLPTGTAFETMTSSQESGGLFGARDLYAAYTVKCVADRIGFGRNSSIASRRLSRFLFYYVIIRMLEQVISATPALNKANKSPGVITDAVVKLSGTLATEQFAMLGNVAVGLIDEYLTAGNQRCAYKELSFTNVHNGDMNSFLKADGLGRVAHTPLLEEALAIHSTAFSQIGGRDKVANVLLAS